MRQVAGSFETSERDSLDFAALSGDFNPLHVDAVHARRLQFGGTVVHGVHHMLLAIDRSLAALGETGPLDLRELDATFPSPVRTGQRVHYTLDRDEADDTSTLTATSQERTVLSLSLRWSRAAAGGHVDPVSRAFSRTESLPIEQPFPATGRAGVCELRYDVELARRLLPFVHRHVASSQIAQILACTRIVGTKCPGLHSLFSGLKLTFSGHAPQKRSPELHYQIAREDSRFRMTRIAVEGPGVNGTLDTFFRPSPVEQPSYATVTERVAGDLFTGLRALVVGGSRGIGETSAKILAAGGADVMLTFTSGADDARRVQDDIRTGGGSCASTRLDVLDLDSTPVPEVIRSFDTTHVLYFASPHITPNPTARWNTALFDRFIRFYVQGFAALVEGVAQRSPSGERALVFYYPSTIYVEQPAKGLAEYATAKGAGETLCHQLAVRRPEIRFVVPRLPRMATDQTSAIVAMKCQSAFEVMRTELSRMVGR